MNRISHEMTIESGVRSQTPEKLPVESGKTYPGSIASVEDNQLLLDIKTNKGSSQVSVKGDYADVLSAGQDVDVTVDFYNGKELKLTIGSKNLEGVTESSGTYERKTIETTIQEIRNVVVHTDNPMKYSKQLDQHIENALNQVKDMVGSFNDGTIGAVLEEGFDAQKMTIDLLYQVGHSGRIGKKLSLEGAQREMTVTVDEAAIEQLVHEKLDQTVLASVDESTMKQVVESLIHNEVEVNQSNVEKMIGFLEKVDKIKNISTKELIHLVSPASGHHVKDLHKSIYVSRQMPNKQVVSEADYEKIQEDIETLLDKELFSGQIDEKLRSEVKSLAKEMVVKGMPLSEEAFSVIRFVLDEQTSLDYLDAGAKQFTKGLNPDMLEIFQEGPNQEILSSEEVKSLVELVDGISQKDIQQIVNETKPVKLESIENLTKKEITPVNESIEQISNANNATVDEVLEQLDLLRFQMTYKAAMRLNITGFDMKQASFERLNRKLEEQELKYTVGDIEAESLKNPEVKAERVDKEQQVEITSVKATYIQLRQQFSMIQGASTESIAEVAIASETVTIQQVSTAVRRGVDRYDELRTKPRGDLGDKIQEAFRNIDTILEDLGLELTEENRRSVEILARNEMPITDENIAKVKAVDIQLQEIIHKLMPEHVKELVEASVDITNEPIENLVAYLKRDESQYETDLSEVIAKSLITLEQQDGLTPEARESIIGIYRMLHTIQQSKGAAVGFLVDQELPVTFETLFDAAKIVRTAVSHRRQLNVSVSENFGLVERMRQEGVSIKEQIQSGLLEKTNQVNGLMNKLAVGPLESEQSLKASPVYKGLVELGMEVVETLKAIHVSNQGDNTVEVKSSLNNIMQMSQQLMKEMDELMATAPEGDKISIKDIEIYQKMSSEPYMLKELLGPIFDLPESYQGVKNQLETAFGQFLDNMTAEGLKALEDELNDIVLSARNETLGQQLGERRQRQDLDSRAQQAFQDQQDYQEQSLQQSSRIQSEFEQENNALNVSKDLNSHLKWQEKLINQDDYFTMPMVIDGQLQQMNVYFFERENSVVAEEEDMTVYLSFSTDNMGSTNARIRLEGEQTYVSVNAPSVDDSNYVKGFESEIAQVFQQSGLPNVMVDYDSFELPKVVDKQGGNDHSKLLKRYSNSRFEQIV